MLIPLYDHNPTDKQPIVTYCIIGLNVLTWLAVQGAGTDPMLVSSFCRFGLVSGDLLGLIRPGTAIQMSDQIICRFDGSPNITTMITSMFMHGGWLHIIGNMWFLWIFGDNVENALGRVRFVLFYILCGLAAAAAQMASDPSSVVPMVGASGAIGGIMGAYLYLHPRTRVKSLLFLGIFFWVMEVPAIVILCVWFAAQFLSLIPLFGSVDPHIAFWAHIGGFIAGLLLVLVLRKRKDQFSLKPRNTDL